MRLNAFISVSLALAFVSSGQMLLAATHKAHRASARHAVLTTVKKRRSSKSSSDAATKHSRRHKRKHHQVSDSDAPATIERVNAPRAQTSQQLLKDDGPSAPAPALYNHRGRLIVPPPMRGSHEILVRQNVVADREGLDRIQDDADLERMRTAHLLVAIATSSALEVDDRLPADRRYTRPWTARFLANLARAHYARFHSPLQVNSAVRTVEFQQRLLHTNGNAAPAEGETASPHLTGQAVDIAKHGLSLTEIAWLRGYLLPLTQQGRIDVEEEFQQSCFHISVYKKYLPSSDQRRTITAHSPSTTTLAAAIP